MYVKWWQTDKIEAGGFEDKEVTVECTYKALNILQSTIELLYEKLSQAKENCQQI